MLNKILDIFLLLLAIDVIGFIIGFGGALLLKVLFQLSDKIENKIIKRKEKQK